jgi:uncharacterized protein
MFDPMRQARALFVPGPAGRIEASFAEGDAARATIVLCHPHPQYGGSMHDAVLDTVARVAQRNSLATLKFNFRGVGASDGSYDSSVGEVEDLLAVLDWLRAAYPSNRILLAGYSFGSNVVWQALDRAGPVALVLLIAPPVGPMQFLARAGPRTPLAVIYGDDDAFVDAATLQRWVSESVPAAHVMSIAGTDHFFSGAHDALAGAVERAITTAQNSATPDT